MDRAFPIKILQENFWQLRTADGRRKARRVSLSRLLWEAKSFWWVCVEKSARVLHSTLMYRAYVLVSAALVLRCLSSTLLLYLSDSKEVDWSRHEWTNARNM